MFLIYKRGRGEAVCKLVFVRVDACCIVQRSMFTVPAIPFVECLRLVSECVLFCVATWMEFE